MYTRVAMFVSCCALLLGGAARADQGAHAKTTAMQRKGDARVGESADLSLQRDRLELDRQKFASDTSIENQKLQLERKKLESETSVFSRLSGMAPWVAGLLTLAFSVLSFRKQAQLQFEIKAAEVAFSGKTPIAVSNRAKALKAMFPNRLPDDFAEGFNPAIYGEKREPSEEKQVFLESLLKDISHKEEVFDLWKALFPGDEEWLQRIEPLCKAPAGELQVQASRAGAALPSAPRA